jgi:hypothetical protein
MVTQTLSTVAIIERAGSWWAPLFGVLVKEKIIRLFYTHIVHNTLTFSHKIFAKFHNEYKA